ncbi:NlpC/P60 family protein [Pacificoceanicola onchidii]|uniref:C40 family peptidase n=1 Tax=Pacificoceanicola onchidii TaxID=2562685 RepID=UPI0010A304FC|nr:NlpC/P60 family protein [Pacificoceanicola onchidii]
MDRRTTPFNGRVAHVSLKGEIDAERFVEGERAVVARGTVDLFPAADREVSMDRQLLLGEVVKVLDRLNGRAFVQADKDGYCGWVNAWQVSVEPVPDATHTVSVRLTRAYEKPDFKKTLRVQALPLGSRVHVFETSDRWSRVAIPIPLDNVDAAEGHFERFVPSSHLRLLTDPETDPVFVAERLVGAPYLWGGNSSFGIDCSGLVQAGCAACGIPCPGDSDMQERELGETLPHGTPPERGDLMFWKGHVAWVSDPETLLHANVYHMAVAYEPMAEAIDRIRAQGDGEVTRHARLPR